MCQSCGNRRRFIQPNPGVVRILANTQNAVKGGARARNGPSERASGAPVADSANARAPQSRRGPRSVRTAAQRAPWGSSSRAFARRGPASRSRAARRLRARRPGVLAPRVSRDRVTWAVRLPNRAQVPGLRRIRECEEGDLSDRREQRAGESTKVSVRDVAVIFPRHHVEIRCSRSRRARSGSKAPARSSRTCFSFSHFPWRVRPSRAGQTDISHQAKRRPVFSLAVRERIRPSLASPMILQLPVPALSRSNHEHKEGAGTRLGALG